MPRPTRLIAGSALVALTVSAIGCRYYEQTNLPASYNWAFRHTYPEVRWQTFETWAAGQDWSGL